MSTGGFAIHRSDGDGVRHLALAGELDLSTAPEVREHLDGCPDGYRVVVDTTELRFVDLGGLAPLVEGREKCGAKFELIAGRATSRLLDLTGLRKFFDPAQV